MDQIRESLNNMAELSADELSALQDAIVAQFDTVDSEEVSAEIVEQMEELANALDTVKSELTNRETQAQQLSEMKEAAVQRVRGGTEDDTTDVVDADVPVEDAEEEATEVIPDDEDAEKKKVASVDDEAVLETETPEAEAAVEEEVIAEEAPVEEASSESTEFSAEDSAEEVPTSEDEGKKVETELSVEDAEAEVTVEAEVAGAEETELTTRKESETVSTEFVNEGSEVIQAPDTHRPSAEVATPVAKASVTITAGGDIPGISNGSQLSNMTAVAQAMIDRMKSVSRSTGGDGESFSVARFNIEYPEDRTLHAGDLDGNIAKIKNVASPQAVTAAGGFCAPVEVSYDIFGFGTTDRPVKASLASFAADRGGIRYTTSPVLGDLDAAVSTWTLQDDIDAATVGGPDPVKPCLRVTCGEEIVVNTDAMPLCLTFGNLQTRAFPELVAANNELAIITQARYAETRLLTRIGALSTSVTAAEKLGASRDFFVQIDQAAAGYRSRHRLSPTESLRVILPSWLKNLVRADITMSMPAGDDQSRFGIADNIVDAWFRARNINVTWTVDGETGQIFGAQAAGGLTAFPSTVVWYLFSEGTFLFLDGGVLDLGLVRDSSLNSINDYKMFVETFEAVAKVGIESLRVTSSLSATGAVAGTVDPATL